MLIKSKGHTHPEPKKTRGVQNLSLYSRTSFPCFSQDGSKASPNYFLNFNLEGFFYFIFIMKYPTDFRKTVETGVDLRLPLLKSHGINLD